MPQSHSALIEHYGRVFPGDPGAVLGARLARMDAIVAGMRDLACAPWLRVFGSAVAAPGLVPGDVDVFLDLGEVPVECRMAAKASTGPLLTLAFAGGYRGNYGLLDPFVLGAKGGVLWARGEDYAAPRWEKAREKAAIVAAGRAGVPLAEFRRGFASEFAAPVDPPPGPRF